MQYSIVSKSELEKTTERIDPEYYANLYNTYLQKIFNKDNIQWKTLSEISTKLTSGHTPYRHDVSFGDTAFLTVECIEQLQLDLSKSKKVLREHVLGELSRVKLKKRDIVISIKRRIVNACPILESPPLMAVNQDIAVLTPKEDIDSSFISSVLVSKVGKYQAYRQQTEQMNPYISVGSLRELKIPLCTEKFQKAIHDIVSKCHDCIKQSEHYYVDAKQLLLSELGLSSWQPKHILSFVRNYSETEQVERIDAEYFQPKYEKLVKAIKNYKDGWDTLENLVSVKKCVEVGSSEYIDEGIPFIRVSNISPFELTEEKYISEKLYSELIQHQPKQGEILFSKDATPGIAYHLNCKTGKMIPSGGILLYAVSGKWDNVQ